MAWVAAVWQLEEDAVDALGGGAMIRRPIADQGSYANPAQFDAFIVGGSMVAVDALEHLGTRVWAWRVEELIPKVGTEPCDVAMVSLMRRSPAITHAGFAEHWTRNHAPLALRRHVGLHDYHQYVVDETLTADTPEVDGIALLGFPTRWEFDERFFDSDEGRAEIMADVARFMDRPGRETTLVGPAGPMRAAG